MKHQPTSADVKCVASSTTIDVVIPAAGIGKRMQADRPKQYLNIDNLPILTHTINRFVYLPYIRHVIIAISDQDQYFATLKQQAPYQTNKVRWVSGGEERADSVLAGLNSITAESDSWVLVHDAARPNINEHDINRLVFHCLTTDQGGILATRVCNTIKSSVQHQGADLTIAHTIPRDNLWQALTPQFFPLSQLKPALSRGLADQCLITDEASAMEAAGFDVLIVEGRSDNIKVTQPEDLALIRYYLQT